MTNSIAPIFLDLIDKQIKTVEKAVKEEHHAKACSCTGKCRVCRCQQKKDNAR